MKALAMNEEYHRLKSRSNAVISMGRRNTGSKSAYTRLNTKRRS
jgi:hypothetical protein